MYRDLVKLQDGERQPGRGYNLTVAVLVFLIGIISGLILVGGCGHTFREVGLAAVRVTGAAMADTGRICTNGAAAMGQVGPSNAGPDSMALDAMPNGDQAVTWSDVERIRKEYGL